MRFEELRRAALSVHIVAEGCSNKYVVSKRAGTIAENT
jgi:hypothetical protein